MKKRIGIALGALLGTLLLTGVLAGSISLIHHILEYGPHPPEMFGFPGMFVFMAYASQVVALPACLLASSIIFLASMPNRKAFGYVLMIGTANAVVTTGFTLTHPTQHSFIYVVMTQLLITGILAYAWIGRKRIAQQEA